jgi:RNA polymerase sigma factor (sigma-70 family)
MTFEGMVEKYSPTLKRIAGKLKSQDVFFDDEDLYQEALLHLWNAHREGTIGDKTDSYILQGCYYHLKNHLRTLRDKAVFISLNNPAGDEGTAVEVIAYFEEVSALDYLEGKLHIQSVLQESGLNDREEEVLRLLMEGMTVREVGTQMGISHVMIVRIKTRIGEKLITAYEKQQMAPEWFRHKTANALATKNQDGEEAIALCACG